MKNTEAGKQAEQRQMNTKGETYVSVYTARRKRTAIKMLQERALQRKKKID